MENTQEQNTIKAPELRVEQWIDANGNKLEQPIKLSDYEGKYKIIYCFQHWCPGCHSVGLPSLKKLVDAFEGNDKIAFLGVQTVFEGAHANTYDKILETQKKYGLKIPFGHDPGKGQSTIMQDYRTGGTPWFIFIDKENNVVFADFHINVDGTIKYFKEAAK
ncbi:TlpA family protein disulfide reductase [Echinicola soli]|uniref:TlpA family protein disulfide reductase n=1 Tax=Echinicola soli TaxID=2591634 RepID=A0A514CFJ7_9BACT|nr:TlpA disulfide reductase family protein [Echinicola soli]QDH78568.1 TlpA family protein disulfide reductase [Echinicola soli]